MASIKKQIEYWRDSAEESCKTMRALNKAERYSDSLFFGHIVLEKLLKAFVVLETKKDAPKIHNLVRLIELSGLALGEDIENYFLVVNSFNIRARYDDYKKSFYKKCTKEYAQENLDKIESIYKKLCQELKQEKS